MFSISNTGVRSDFDVDLQISARKATEIDFPHPEINLKQCLVRGTQRMTNYYPNRGTKILELEPRPQF